MGSSKGIYKRGNVWWIRYAGLNGRIHFESSRTTSFREAEDLLVKRKREILEGREPNPVKRIGNHSFQELSEHYLTWAERQRAIRSKRGFVQQLVEVFGNCPLRGISTRLIEEFQTKRMATNKPATVNRLLATLKHMLKKAVEWEMVEEKALKNARRVKLLPENNRRLRYLSREECRNLLKAACPHLKAILLTALNTGMRKEEILSLEWEKHVDLKHGFILLDVTKNGERREIPINEPLRKVLQAMVRRVGSPYVFTNRKGRRFKDIKTSFKTACTRAKIKDFRFHDLRHTFASHLVMAGADLTTVKELLGHKTLTMTLRYAHLAPGHKVKAVEMLEDVFGRGLTKNSTPRKPTIQKLYNRKKNGLASIS
ncbi:MAG: tyrosine-type recombinase/integrase [Nitrospiria bacterium]